MNVPLTCTSMRQLTNVTSCMGQVPVTHSCVVQPSVVSSSDTHCFGMTHSQGGTLGSLTLLTNPHRPPTELHPHVIRTLAIYAKTSGSKLCVQRDHLQGKVASHGPTKWVGDTVFKRSYTKVTVAVTVWSTCWRYPVQIPLGQRFFLLYEVCGCCWSFKSTWTACYLRWKQYGSSYVGNPSPVERA